MEYRSKMAPKIYPNPERSVRDWAFSNKGSAALTASGVQTLATTEAKLFGL
jgi:hypothetical protein